MHAAKRFGYVVLRCPTSRFRLPSGVPSTFLNMTSISQAPRAEAHGDALYSFFGEAIPTQKIILDGGEQVVRHPDGGEFDTSPIGRHCEVTRRLKRLV